MSTTLKAAALAAAAFIAAPAQAMDTTFYTFTVNGSGYNYTRPSQDAPESQYRFTYFNEATFTFAVRPGPFVVPVQNNAPFQQGNLSFGTSSERLLIDLINGQTDRFIFGSTNVQVCGDFASGLPRANGPVAFTPNCGTAQIGYTNGQTAGTQFRGTVSSFNVSTVTDYFGSPFQFVIAVPEPSTWAMMLTGFALTGYALRRRRARVAFA